MVKDFLEQNKYDIIALYRNGMLQREIALLYNTSKASIGRLLRANGLCRAKITEVDYKQISQMYLDGVTIKNIAKQYRISESTVSSILHSMDIKVLTYGEHSKKYSLNEHYFDCIDTQDKAYILGLLYADGCNTGKFITLSLQCCDKHILEAINNALDSNRPLKFLPYSEKNSNWSDRYKLSITNKYMATQLEQLGMVQHKSLILTFSEWMEDSLIPSFLRGYMDGDGSINKKECRVNFIGTESFCKTVAKILKEKLNIHCGIYLSHKNNNTTTRMLQIAGRNQVKSFLDYIYKDANLFLYRKYEIYQTMYYPNNINNT